MLISKYLLPGLLLCSLVSAASAQQVTSPPSARDAQAFSLLQEAITAGGPETRQIKDFSASGTITYYWNDQEVFAQVEIRGKGLDQVRMDSRAQDAVHSVVVNHHTGTVTNSNSNRKVLSLNASHFGLLVLALPNLVAVVDDPLASFWLSGTEQIGGSTAYKVQVVRGISSQLEHDQRLRKLKTSEVLIDSATFMILAIRHPYLTRESGTREVVREVSFSNFRQVNGVTVPFRITEKLADQPTWTINLAAIEFNRGLADEIFHH